MRVQMRAEINKLHSRLQSTMIYVTHDQVEAMTMGDRIVVMNDGVIQQVDDPISLYDNPKNLFVAGFIGSPPMNFFRGTIQQRTSGLWFAEKTSEASKSGGFSVRIEHQMAGKLTSHVGKAVVLGLHPEDIYDGRLAGESKPDQMLRCTVDVVEPMGAEIHLHLSAGTHTFVARVNSRETTDENQPIDMVFDMRKCHFFDAQTEQVIA
jgi:multiple sugar transport system ATP-binding protein